MDQAILTANRWCLLTVVGAMIYLLFRWCTHHGSQSVRKVRFGHVPAWEAHIGQKAVSSTVPTVGRPGILGPWIDAVTWAWDARDRIQKGYNQVLAQSLPDTSALQMIDYHQYSDYAFRVSTPNGWETCICNLEMIKEYKNLMDNQMSALAVTSETFQARYTLPGGDWDNIHQLPPQSAVARALMWLKGRAANEKDPYYSEMMEVFECAFQREIIIPARDHLAIACFPQYCRVVAAITAKALLGSMAADSGAIDQLVKYAEAVPRDGFLIAIFPKILRPLVARLCTAPKLSDQLINLLLEEIGRRRAMNIHGEPQDMTDWMVQWVEKNPKNSMRGAAARIIATFFGGIHTTTQLIVHSLFEIATRPEYVRPLREEIEGALAAHGGWNKTSLESMVKLDSFVKECQRYNPLDAASLSRQATCDFQFSNGLHLRKGTYLFAPNGPMVGDSHLYPSAHEFDGMRFWKLGQKAQRLQDCRLVASSATYLQFGDGRHICPGRFMAADEVRLLLAYTLWRYDVAIEGHRPRPKNTTFKRFCFPDMSAKIELKTRL
ncbi:cytochrome P450 [Aspergillus similis]